MWFPQISGLECLHRAKEVCWSQGGMLKNTWLASTLKQKQKENEEKENLQKSKHKRDKKIIWRTITKKVK